MSQLAPPAGAHDVGGLEAGPVDRAEHDTAHWEWQIDAMIRLALEKGLLSDFAELRDGIERLTAADYEQFGYYERWAKSLAWVLVDKGVIDAAALADRVEAIRARQEKASQAKASQEQAGEAGRQTARPSETGKGA